MSVVERTYIVDGHHRVAATLQRGLTEGDPGGRVLVAAFPHDDLRAFPFHRWVDREVDAKRALPRAREPRPGTAVAVTKSGEWEIDLDNQPDEADVAALSRTELRGLGIEDERTDPRIEFVPGAPGSERLRHHVGSRGGIGFLLAAPTIEEVMDCSDRGEHMPPKATFFSPKPRSGVFLVKR